MSHATPLPIRVVLADDHTMVREALARILDESGDIQVVAQAHDGNQVLQAIRETTPDVVVLDYTLPDEHAPEVIEKALRQQSKIRVLVLTVHQNIHYAVRVLEAGAFGYLIKSAAADELVAAIKTVREGRIYLSSAISQEVLHHLRRPKRERIGLESLSQREFDFLRLIGTGKGLQECAKVMKVSPSTASTYRSRIMEKLNLHTTAELIRFALENNVVE